MLFRLLIAIFALTLVTSCGSSSSSNKAPSPAPAPQAKDDPKGGDADNTDGGGDTNGGAKEPEEPKVPEAPQDPNVISFKFVDGIKGWHINGTGNTTTTETQFLRLVHDAEQKAMLLQPKAWDAENWRLQARYELDAGVSFVDARAVLELDIPQSYFDDGAVAFQLILLGNSDDSYGDYITLADFDTDTRRVEIDLGERGEDLSHIGMVAIQFAQGPGDNSITDPIAVRSLEFYLNEEGVGKDENGDGNDKVLTLAVDGGWSNDGSPASFSYDNGVVIAPVWSGQNTAMKVLGETADFTGATVTWVIDVPEAYITDGELVIQPYVQQNAVPHDSVNDSSIPGGWIKMSDLQPGENTIEHGPFEAPPENIGRAGIWLKPNGLDTSINAAIVIRSVTITFAEE